MDPRLTMMVLQREHDQRMKAVMREVEIRRALEGQPRAEGGSRSIAAGVRRALRLVDARWAGLNSDRRRDDAKPRTSGERLLAYRGERAAA